MKIQTGAPDQLEVYCTPLQADAMKRIPGSKWDSDLKCWLLPQQYPVWIQFRAELSRVEFEIEPAVNEWVDYCYAREIELWHAVRSKDADVFHFRADEIRPLQRVGIDWMRRAGSGILADGMGAGKTVQASALANTTSDSVIVVCPKSVVGSWIRHTNEWTGLTPRLAVGGIKQRDAAISEWRDNGGVLIINWEATHLHSRLAPYGAIAMKRCPEHKGTDEKVTPARCHVHEKNLNGISFDLLIMDEAHRAKDPKSLQTRAVFHLAKSAHRRIALTGTPVEGNPKDIWPLLHMVDPDAWPSRGKFIERYADMQYNPHSGHYEPVGIRMDRLAEWNRVRDMYLLRRSFKEVTGRDIKKVRSRRTVTLAPKQRKVYRELATEAAVELDNGETLIIDSHLSATTRCIQAASAALEVDVDVLTDPETGEVSREQRVRMVKPSPKLDELWRLWNDDMAREPLVIMAGGPGSRQLVDLTAAMFADKGIPYSMIVGGMSDVDRTEQVERYMTGNTMVFIGQTQAAGEGLDLDRGDTLAFIMRPSSLIQNDQAENRVRRFTQAADAVHIVDIVTEDTYDERTLDLFRDKRELFDQVMGDPAQRKALL